MSVQTDNDIVIYNGEFRHGVDDKRRVQVPSRWCPSKSADFALVVWPTQQAGPCLRALPPVAMSKLMLQVETMPSSDPNKGMLKRRIGGRSNQARLDSAGRICIPEELAEIAKIKDKVVLVGLLDRFEIWNPAAYEIIRNVDPTVEARAYELME